jgi:hypothetical protein
MDYLSRRSLLIDAQKRYVLGPDSCRSYFLGLAAGYVSHLALDAGTPRSIPLLVGGF